jgi:hypothetical protein
LCYLLAPSWRLKLLCGVDPSVIKRDAPTSKIAFRIHVVLIRNW